MKKELISKNKTQSLHRIYSFEDAKKHFPSQSFSQSKRALRLFLDIESLDEKLLEDFTKHLLLFNDNGNDYYIVVNIGDQVDATSITDQKLLKDATKLMANYSVSESFVSFLKSSQMITEKQRIENIKKFTPEYYLDYTMEKDHPNSDISSWNWLPRNLIKKQLLSDTKYLSYLIKKDKESNKNYTSVYIINYLLAGTLTKKTKNFLNELFEDKTSKDMFQELIDKIFLKNEYIDGVSLTKSILKNIFLLQEENIIEFKEFASNFISTLKSNFKDEYLDYLNILIDNKVKYVIEPETKQYYDCSTSSLFFNDKVFNYLISHAENIDDIAQSWRKNFSHVLYGYCFKRPEKYSLNNFDEKQEFDFKNLENLLSDPLRSKFVFFEDFFEQYEQTSKNDSFSRSLFSEAIAKTSLNLLVEKAPSLEFFENNIIHHYSCIIKDYNEETGFTNSNYQERLDALCELDKNYINLINLTYLFQEKYEHLDEIFDFDYNSQKVQKHFENTYNDYIAMTNENYLKERKFNDIKHLADNKRFIKHYDSSKWDNKALVELLDPIVNFDTDYDLSELKKHIKDNDYEKVAKYCEENAAKIKNTFKRNSDDPFVKIIKAINNAVMR